MSKLSILNISLMLSLVLPAEQVCAADSHKKHELKKTHKKTAVKKESHKDNKTNSRKSHSASETRKPKKAKGASKKVNKVGYAVDTEALKKTDALHDALTSAYLSNSTLKAKLHSKYATDESVAQAMSAFRPSVGVTGTVQNQLSNGHAKSNNNQTVSPVNPFSPRDSGVTDSLSNSRDNTKNGSATLEVKQSLYRGGGDLAGLRSAETGVQASLYDLINTEQDTFTRAVQAYMEVYFQRSSVASKEANVKFLEQQLKAIKAQVEVGEKTPTETAAAESQLALGVADLVKSQGGLESGKANYINVIGQEPGALEYPSSLKGIPNTFEEVLDTALKNNPAVINAEYVAKKAGIDIDVASASLLPRLDLAGSVSKNLQDVTTKSNSDSSFTDLAGNVQGPVNTVSKSKKNQNSNQAAVGLTLTIPIYQGGAEYSKIRQQVESTASARYQLEQARKTVHENAVKSWEALVTSRQQIESFKKQVASATIARNGAQLEADVGERSYIDVLKFQQDLLTAEISLQDARRNEINAQYQLFALMGKLTARALKLPVPLYDVEGHLDDVRYKMIGFGDNPEILDGKDEQSTITAD